MNSSWIFVLNPLIIDMSLIHKIKFVTQGPKVLWYMPYA